MALNRKYLDAMSVEEKVADQILEEHSADMNRIKGELDGWKAKAADYEAVKKELDELKANPGDDYKAKYEAERKAFADYKADVEAQEGERVKRGLYRELLGKSGIDAKRIESVLKVSDLSKVAVKDGALENADELESAIKEDWADFIPRKSTEGANVAHPPASGSGKPEPRTLAEALRQRQG